MADLHDLAAAYALDALDATERTTFEKHLEGCASCRHQVDEAWATMGELGDLAATPPPPAMRRAVMERIAATPQESPGVDPGPAHPPADPSAGVVPLVRRPARWVAAVAVAAVAVVGVLLLIDTGTDVDDVLAAPDAVTLPVQSEAVPDAALVFSPELGRGVFTAGALPAVDEDETYQLWLIEGETPTPAGLFVPDDDGEVEVLLDGEVAAGQVLGLTVEPAGGSDSPTGEILVATPIGEA
ncbi:MAG: anti-sigma factor [Acidimicrobiia bacterium]